MECKNTDFAIRKLMLSFKQQTSFLSLDKVHNPLTRHLHKSALRMSNT